MPYSKEIRKLRLDTKSGKLLTKAGENLFSDGKKRSRKEELAAVYLMRRSSGECGTGECGVAQDNAAELRRMHRSSGECGVAQENAS
jgi:hypothetical protein